MFAGSGNVVYTTPDNPTAGFLEDSAALYDPSSVCVRATASGAD
jgi:hypothetical protein